MSSKERTSVSEALTTPLGRGLSSAGMTALTLAGVNKLLGTRKASELFARMGARAPMVSAKGIAGASLGSGGLSALTANMDRSIYANHLADKLKRRGKGFTSNEKKLVGRAMSSGPEFGSKSFSEHYFSPASMGAFRAALGGLMGGFSPMAAIEGGLAGSGGTVANKAIMSRALKSRIDSGKRLTPAEARLARMIGGGRNA